MKRYFYGFAFTLIVSLSACVDSEIKLTSGIIVGDQVISQNIVTIPRIIADRPVWVALYSADENGKMDLRSSIAKPLYLFESGTYYHVGRRLSSQATISDSMRVWVALHEDTGVEGEFEFEENGSADQLLEVEGSRVYGFLTIYEPAIEASDQSLANQILVFERIAAGRPSWIVVSKKDESGSEVIVDKIAIEAGVYYDHRLMIDNSISVEPGDEISLRLHMNLEPFDEFDYPGEDDVEIFGRANTVVEDKITIL